ncbi:aqualysin-1-like [Amphiura filiformis]|uniref:aqualysin-1-like n=1 Tax=Amphiura filiformis TaxID=82378 RepID=UPI003B2121E2
MMLLVLFAVLAVSCAELAPLMTDNEPVPGSYIVVLEDNVDVDQFASSLQMMALTNDVSTMEIKWKYSFGLAIRSFPDANVNLLQGLKGVKYVEQDGVVKALQGVGSWGLDRIDQRGATLDNMYSYTSTGKDIPVWVIDTGINYDHVDVLGRAELFFDYENGDGKDCQGHGSHCAGTVGGTVYGVAKEAHLFSCRTLSCSGSGYKSDSIEALNRITASGMGPGVVSMSLGGSTSDAQDTAVANCVAAGYVVSVAAGNDNSNACNGSPARAPEAITVGATQTGDSRASYSNYGTCVDIFAPGSSITSIDYRRNSGTSVKSGTSMACPHVSGAAAKIFATNPGWSPGQVENEMKSVATTNAVGNPGSGSPNLLLYSK